MQRTSKAMHGQSAYFVVPNRRRDITRDEIERIYQRTGSRVAWQRRGNRGAEKKVSATGPLNRCEEAVQLAINFMTQEVAPTFAPASTTAVQQMTEEAQQRRAEHSGHWRFLDPAVLSIQHVGGDH